MVVQGSPYLQGNVPLKAPPKAEMPVAQGPPPPQNDGFHSSAVDFSDLREYQPAWGATSEEKIADMPATSLLPPAAEKLPVQSAPVILTQGFTDGAEAPSTGDELRAILDGIAAELESFDQKMQPPCGEKQLAKLHKNVNEKLHTELPEEYASFLRKAGGLDYNGMVMYGHKSQPIAGCRERSIDGVVEANERLRDCGSLAKYLILGESEDTLYAYHPATAKYVEIDNSGLRQCSVCDTFQELFMTALQAHA